MKVVLIASVGKIEEVPFVNFLCISLSCRETDGKRTQAKSQKDNFEK